jgi:hypothetical protein
MQVAITCRTAVAVGAVPQSRVDVIVNAKGPPPLGPPPAA